MGEGRWVVVWERVMRCGVCEVETGLSSPPMGIARTGSSMDNSWITLYVPCLFLVPDSN